MKKNNNKQYKKYSKYYRKNLIPIKEETKTTTREPVY